MFKIKVIKTPDYEKIGTFEYHKNLIYLGNTPQCDLYLNDPGLITDYLFIEVAEGKCIAHPNSKIEYYLVNKKRTTGYKYLNIGDKIQIGDSEIMIESFLESNWKSPREVLNQTTDELIAIKSPLIEIMSAIEEKIKDGSNL